MLFKIAITGNIASGKSQVEKILEDFGYPVYDADKIAHKVLDEITDFYGLDVFTQGKIDRKKLGRLAFSDSDIRRKLEELTHPKIRTEILNLFEEHQSDNYIFISVPLLYEAGFEDLFDKVLFISVDKQIQLERLMARNNLTKDEALMRINSQLAETEKLQKADYILKNNSTLDTLEAGIKEFLTELSQANI